MTVGGIPTFHRMMLRLLLVFALLLAPAAHAPAETLKIGALKFGTVNWLIDTIEAERLETRGGFTIERVRLASNQALTVALQAGAVDLIVSDWPWAMRRRTEGEPLLFAPYTGALGAVMARNGDVASLNDLKGRRLGVAGSALDKSWLLLRAHAKALGVGDLSEISEPTFAAPPLLSEQLKLGRLDAVLTYWHFAARLDADGYDRIADMSEVIKTLGVDPSPPMVGFVWREELSREKGPTVDAFLRAVAEANAVLKRSDAAWERLRPAMKAGSEAEFQRLKQYFRRGIPGPWGGAETKAAERLFNLLKQLGGDALVGPAARFDAALFRSPGS